MKSTKNRSARAEAGNRLAAITAVLMSLAIHAVFFSFFPPMEVRVERERVMPPRKHYPVQLSPARYLPVDQPARPVRFKPENPEIKSVVPSVVNELRSDPGESLVAPDSVPVEALAGAGGERRTPAEAAPAWVPRQEILRIEEKIAVDSPDAPPRRPDLSIRRNLTAPDEVPPAERTDIQPGLTTGKTAVVEFGREAIVGITRGGTGETFEAVAVGRDAPLPLDDDFEELTGLRKIEKLLTVSVQTCVSPADREFAYFRMEVKRLGDSVLPVMPKDIVFVQDCSASMTEQRLHFCRQGLLKAMDTVGQGDNFNVVYFRDRIVKCFPGWTNATPASVETAREFIRGMISEGETDIFASTREILAMRGESRPMVVQMVTDGRPTTGVTDSTEIIERFSRLNDAKASFFIMGTIAGANAYLLDLLAYRNRGDAMVVTTGRWDIPDQLCRMASELARPVLADVRHHFAKASLCEVYPVRPTHLYLDRPLVLFGRYPIGTGDVVFQIVGRGEETDCDMIFSMDLAKVRQGDERIRQAWAWQKIYHLIGEYTRSRDARLLDQIRSVAGRYRINVPYRLEERGAE